MEKDKIPTIFRSKTKMYLNHREILGGGHKRFNLLNTEKKENNKKILQ